MTHILTRYTRINNKHFVTLECIGKHLFYLANSRTPVR